MGFIAICLLSYPATLLLGLDYSSRIAKYAAKQGKLINVDYFKDNKNNTGFNSSKIKYIPIVNAINMAMLDSFFISNKELMYLTLNADGAFYSMTKEEEDYYNERPTYLRLMNLASMRKKQEQELLDRIKNVNNDDNIRQDIINLNKETIEHDIIIEKDSTDKSVSIEELIDTMTYDELTELKDTLTVFKDYKKHFDEEPDGEYVINSKNDRILKLNFRNNDRRDD